MVSGLQAIACSRDIPYGHLHRVTYTGGGIDTIVSPNDDNLVVRNVYRIGINKYKKKNCASSWLFTKTEAYKGFITYA